MSQIYRLPGTLRQFSFMSIVSVLLLMLAGCGAGSASTSTGSSSGSPTNTPAPTATTIVKGYGNLHGCPSDTVVATAPKQANVIIRNTDSNATISAHVGDIIEIRLPFGHKWGGPASVPPTLQQLQPAGYAFPTDNVCVWRFTAQSAGTANLEFHSQALCLKGQMCPMFIALNPFTITVK